MNKVKVSIIIPVYNAEKYLNECLDSIVNQNFKQIEIIIVNDNSIDKSLEIIKEYELKDKRIILINKEETEGVSAARNSGLKIARGKWIQYFDSDDWVENDYIENVYKFAEKEDLDIVCTNYYVDYKNKRILKKLFHKKKVMNSLEYIKEFFNNYESSSMCNRFIKKELYYKNNILSNEKILLGEDLLIILKLFYFSEKIGFLDEAFYHYRQNNTSITHSKRSLKMIQIFEVFKELNEFFIKNEPKYLNLLYIYSFSHILGFLLMKPYYFEKNYRKACLEFINWVKDSKFEKNKNRISKKVYYLIEIIKLFPNWRTIYIISFILSKLKGLKDVKEQIF